LFIYFTYVLASVSARTEV